MQITRDDLARMFPRARADWLDAFARLAPPLIEHYKWTRLDWVHCCGQISAETSGLTLLPMVENLNYKTLDRILEVFGYRIGLAVKNGQRVFGKRWTSKTALAKALLGHPVETARVAYSNREGTPAEQGDRYIGRGPLQTTHLNNYRRIGEEIARQPGGASYDLVANPEILGSDPDVGVRAIFAEWHVDGFSRWACSDDCDTLSDALNTGNVRDNVKPHALPERRRQTARAKAIWPAVATEPGGPDVGPRRSVLAQGMKGEGVRALQERLVALKFPVGAIDGDFGQLTRRAVVAFQDAHALKVDGIVGPRTWEVIDATAPADLGERENVSAADLRKSGSRTLKAIAGVRNTARAVKVGVMGLGLDQYFSLGGLDAVVSAGERVKSVAARGQDLVGVTPTPGHGTAVALALGALFLVAWLVSRSADKAEAARVADARDGKNLAR